MISGLFLAVFFTLGFIGCYYAGFVDGRKDERERIERAWRTRMAQPDREACE